MSQSVTPDVLVIGEALMDVVVGASGVTEHPGGSPMNVSLGVARLGIPTTFATALGDDEYGRAISTHLEASGVVLVPGRDAHRRTSSARVSLDESGAPSYLFDVDWSPDLSEVADLAVAHVHTGSIGAFLAPGAADVEALIRVRADTATVSFDPNIRAQFLPDHAAAVAQVERYIALADVVKASDEDVEWLYPGADLGDVMSRWRSLGVSLVVVTRGREGALAQCAGGELVVPGRVVEVVDSIGAGDAFMSGMIAGLHARALTGAAGRAALAELPLSVAHEIVDLAMLCGAMTVARAGAQPPTRAELPAGAL